MLYPVLWALGFANDCVHAQRYPAASVEPRNLSSAWIEKPRVSLLDAGDLPVLMWLDRTGWRSALARGEIGVDKACKI